MVKKLEKGSTVTCAKLSQINLKKSYQKLDKPKTSASSSLHWDTSHPNVPTRKLTKQSSLEDKEAYFREDALLTKKKATRSLTAQKKKQ
jgi:uncharacterized membrane-anchored protein YhcB (DUF1043 family)